MGEQGRSYLVEKVLKEQLGVQQETQPASQPEGDVSLQEALEQTLPEIREGDVIKGTVEKVLGDGVLVNVGRKAEGFIPALEWGGDFRNEVKVGDEVEVYVLKVEDDDEGLLRLSKRRADYERAWRQVYEAHKSGEILQVLVKDRVKGGLVVDLGVDGFVPASQVLVGRQRSIEHFVGRTMKVKIIEVDRKAGRVICSNKIALEEERERMKKEALSKVREGEVLKGEVRRLTNFGAFVDLGGVEGLLHVSEMSWSRVEHPSEVLRVGQTVDVVVLRYDPASERISLGMRQLLPDPWRTAERDYPLGSTVKAKVSRIVASGAFVKLPTGIEGIIPLNELSERRVQHASDVVSVGEEVEAKVIQVSLAQRRIMLSLRQVTQERERKQLRDLMHQQTVPTVTLGDLQGERLDRIAQSLMDPSSPAAARDVPPTSHEQDAPPSSDDSQPKPQPE